VILTGAVDFLYLAALSAANGSASAFFFPASQGIVPETVPPHLLQPANALLRLGVNATLIGGAALGGVTVAVVGAGWALVVDGLSYLVSGAFLLALRLAPRLTPRERASLLHDLRVGWRAFSSHTWLWVIVVAFAFMNAAHVGVRDVLLPAIAKDELGGAGAYGLIVAGFGAGLVLGGLVVLRWRPSRLLLVGCAATACELPLVLLLAADAPLPLLVAAGLLTGIGFEIFGVFWDVALQQNVPRDSLSRVYSYDALGSFVLIPLGLAVAGPAAATVGIDPTLWVCAGVIASCVVAMLAVRDVRTIRRRDEAVA
jgi:predicted MFS family arabinose efflux permease